MSTKTRAKPKKMGRPKINIDWDTIENYLKLGATLDDISYFTNLNKNTIQKRTIEQYGFTFSTLLKREQAHTKLSVRSELMKKVKSGNTSAIIFASKTLGGLMEEVEKQELDIKRQELDLKKQEVEAVQQQTQINQEMIDMFASQNDLEQYES